MVFKSYFTRQMVIMKLRHESEDPCLVVMSYVCVLSRLTMNIKWIILCEVVMSRDTSPVGKVHR
jgi:hypothetical protein